MYDKPLLIVGANGKTGRRVASRLTAMGAQVRNGSRKAPIPFDWDKPETWQPVLDGIGRAYVTFYPDIAMPGAVDKVQAFAAAARHAGVERLVLLSGRGEHHARLGEDAIRKSGVDFTLVRAAWFAQNFSEGDLRAPIMAGVLPMPGGDVREPIIDIDDIADVAVAALTEDRHSGALYEVTGPRLMTFSEMAKELSSATGRQIQYVPIGFQDFRASVAESAGTVVADILTAIARETLDGRNARLSDGVERALGRTPRDFFEFARAASNAGAWTDAA